MKLNTLMFFVLFCVQLSFKIKTFHLFNKQIMNLWVGKLLKMETNYLF